MTLAKPVYLRHDRRLARRCLALVRLAIRAPLDASLLAAGLPYAGMFHTVLAPKPYHPVTLWSGARVVVASLAVALDLADISAPLLVPADVVAAGHGAGLDGLVADNATGPSTGVIAAVGSLMAAGIEAAVSLASVFFASVAGRWSNKS